LDKTLIHTEYELLSCQLSTIVLQSVAATSKMLQPVYLPPCFCKGAPYFLTGFCRTFASCRERKS